MRELLRLAALFIIVMTSCEPDEPIEPVIPAEKTVPKVEAKGIFDLTFTSVTITGQVSSDGGDPIISRGVCWSVDKQFPTLEDSVILYEGPDSIFSVRLAGLMPGARYYARPFAVNKIGTGFAMYLSFSGLGFKPTLVSFRPIPEVASARLTATVNPNWLETAVVFEYGVSPDELYDSVSVSGITGTEDTIVGVDIAGFDPNISYFFRVKARNSLGTTVSEIKSSKVYAVQDVDGNYYHSVKIGQQTWLVENLKVEHYADGSPIPNVTNGVEWATLNTGAYCYYDNDISNKSVYGALYNWYAVDDSRKLAPDGWHVPSDGEWTKLKAFLGSAVDHTKDVSGAKMKEAGTAHWQYPNSGSTNSSGFTGLPGGVKNLFWDDGKKIWVDGGFHGTTTEGRFWSSTDFWDGGAWEKSLHYDWPYLFNDQTLPKTFGLSVRCVKN